MHPVARHRCMIYDDAPEQHLPTIAGLLNEELRAGTRCVYLNSPEMVRAIRTCLTSFGVDVDAELDERTLILSSDRSYLVNGHFDSPSMLNHIEAAVAEAQADGFLRLWVSGDMTWEFGDHQDFTDLLAFERGSELLFEKHPMLEAVCQYHRDSLPPNALRDALSTHQSVYINQTLFRHNPYFRPPTAVSAAVHIPTDLNHLIERFRLYQ